MQIAGIQKLTLLDYPGYTACTLFTSGCNFRCPFCHNSGLVLSGGKQDEMIGESEILEYLKSRKGKLDGVCITGGEPLIHSGLKDFMAKIKAEGFRVKLDTNGSFFDKLRDIVDGGFCDYVAMDIKNTPRKYRISAGADVDIESVKKSVEFLKSGKVDYEFRTTVVRELNEIEDFKIIADWLNGAKGYYLQKFKDSGAILEEGYSAYSDEDMHKILDLVQGAGLKNSFLRGVD